MKRILISTAVAFAAGSIMLACGGSDDKKATPGASTGGGGANNGGSSNGGTGAKGGSSNGGTSNGGTSNGGTANGGNGGNATGCDLAPCTGKKAFGQFPVDACCMTATECGVSSAQFMNGTCFPLSQLPQGGDGGGLPGNEPVDLDPTCPGFDIPDAGGLGTGFGMDGGIPSSFKGCCDKSNVCGFALQVNLGPLKLEQCITGADGAQFGAGFDAGPPKACTYKAP